METTNLSLKGVQMRLANGAQIEQIYLRRGQRGERKWVGKVHAYLPHNDLHPWAVWGVASDDGEVFDAFNGVYWSSEDEARSAYLSRGS